ncbi:alpha/beta hydrolase [Paludibaculum fermentans]|uniref:Alpha/beta hydrolase n=1 Tax=Paludibaculum fermentans TaxID=1473598 RepID=A0A7S7SKQ7_PALFE|nr:alpha/beta hydrolase fold domain-containing protein [Paludibaculum fermentans]QOY87681.1 alpha/beta hydrolase [Paludibaculum fermentans]
MHHIRHSASLLFLLATALLQAQQPSAEPRPTTAAEAPQRDTSYIDAQGTAHITRVVPVPKTLSPQAQRSLSRQVPDQGPPQSLAERRKSTDAYTARARAEWTRLCPNQLVEDKIAGVPVRIVTPEGMPASNQDKVLLNLHGGGFNSDSGSYTESIPIASYTRIKVVAVLYRLAPEHPFPAAVDDSIAVYRELLKTYKPGRIVIYGTSAGAILTAQVAVRLKQLGLPQPAALGIFSGMGDFSRNGDSLALFSLGGLSGHLEPPIDEPHDPEYATTTNPRDPVLSPIFSDLRGLPPTLFITSGRDLLLSGTVDLHRAYYNAGVDARLVVFDALPHAFWYNPNLPEAIEANHIMAGFFLQQLMK